jgi:hypothetical protein
MRDKPIDFAFQNFNFNHPKVRWLVPRNLFNSVLVSVVVHDRKNLDLINSRSDRFSLFAQEKKMFSSRGSKQTPMLDPLVNRGCAFTEDERKKHRMVGLLPSAVESEDAEVQRFHALLEEFTSPLQKHVMLNTLHETNTRLFYKYVCSHLV